MKNDFFYNLFLFMVCLFAVFGLIVLIIILVVTCPFNFNKVKSIEDCRNLSIEDSVRCSVNFISQYYFYNESNLNENLTTSELLKEGGVCRHYSLFYNQTGKDFGFNTKEIRIRYNNSNGQSEGHVFDIWYNEEGWCYLDQNKYGCFKFGKSSENITQIKVTRIK